MRKLGVKSFKSIPGKYYDTPKELWGFRSDRGDGTPSTIANTFLEANRETLGIMSALDRLEGVTGSVPDRRPAEAVQRYIGKHMDRAKVYYRQG